MIGYITEIKIKKFKYLLLFVHCINLDMFVHNITIKIRKGDFMADLTQVELQHLRHLIGAHETAYQKLNAYSMQVQDAQIKQLFTKSAQDALNTKQKLMGFLNN